MSMQVCHSSRRSVLWHPVHTLMHQLLQLPHSNCLMPLEGQDISPKPQEGVSPDRETHILAALTDYRPGSQSLQKVTTTHSLPYSTLCHHVQGCKTRSDGHSSQKLLSQVQEDILVSWCEYQASMAEHLMHTTLQEHVRLLSSKVCSNIWVRRFLCRHATTIIAAKAQGLDPK